MEDAFYEVVEGFVACLVSSNPLSDLMLDNPWREQRERDRALTRLPPWQEVHFYPWGVVLLRGFVSEDEVRGCEDEGAVRRAVTGRGAV